MRHQGVRAAVAALVIALASAGCGGGKPADTDATPTATSSAAPVSTSGIDRSRKFVAKVHAEGSGAGAFVWDGEREVVLNRVGKPGMEVNILSVGFSTPQIVTDDRALRFRWAFDLLNAYADQPGTFTIDATPQGEQGLRSSAFLIFMKAKDPAAQAVYDMAEVEFFKQFNQLRKPCTLEVGAGERTGTLVCPELATTDGETAGLTVRWEQTGPDLPE